MADVHQEKDCFELPGAVKIALDHLPPLGFDLHISRSIAVPRQIYQIEPVIDIIIIDGLGLPRLGAGSCKRFPVHQSVDQGRFSHIALSGKGKFHMDICRQLTGNTAHRFETNIFNYHF